MDRPPNGTILLDDSIPWDISKGDVIGIDTQFVNVGNQLFRGFKLIPHGLHLFHYSRNDMRYGTWFECNEGDVYLARWDLLLEEIKLVDLKNEPLNLTKALDKIAQYYGTVMMGYPEDTTTWHQLIGYMDNIEVLQIFLPEDYEVTTSTSSFEETMILEETLAGTHPNSSTGNSSSHDHIKYTVVQFKKNRSTDINTITKDYLDKSWYIEELYGQDVELLLAELQLAFVNFIVLANFCSGYQWIQIIKLILMSPQWIGRRLSWFVKLLQLLVSQLRKIPPEYVFGEDSIINTQSYIEAMENIVQDIIPSLEGSCCGRMKMKGAILETWNQVIDINNERFSIDLTRLTPSIDDNDEDAPQIVHT
ncbi:uncharacterized protein KQ657_004162 [Scheffersomyces spartinae]|uniref:A1 cistron-splicing factor n=1 Tax=Scheffersomyces spartinae TaxID=45513 RepID=A0A9P7VC25_9ASCO|nr:uncharacterized protein KQ657_004162 [Scheffersomyces spartinae]KAG7195048.1 hypothetical protein KQ657_004162 [Scheffersomyces spartinae]